MPCSIGSILRLSVVSLFGMQCVQRRLESCVKGGWCVGSLQNKSDNVAPKVLLADLLGIIATEGLVLATSSLIQLLQGSVKFN